MISRELRSATKKLSIDAVVLRSSNISIDEQYNVLNINKISKKAQSRRGVERIEILEAVKEENLQTIKYFYSFHYSIASRLVRVLEENEEESDDDQRVMLSIESIFEAFYTSDIQLSKEELEAFAGRNVGFNVWPYWREYLQSTCTRMGVNPIAVPFYKYEGSDIPQEIVEGQN